VEAVTVTASDTVEVTTTVPWVAFPSYLGGARLGMMAQAQLDDPTSCAREPIGTGPFRFESWSPNTKLIVERNEDYWQVAPDGEPYPYLDRIEFRPIPDVGVRTNALRAGDIDVLHTSSVGTIVGDLRELRDQGDANLFVSEVAAEVGFIMLNHTRPPFDDLRIRKALVMAIDRDKSNQTDNDGLGTIATGPFAPGMVGYLEDSGFPEFDLDEATRLVAEYEAEGTKAETTLSIANDPGLQTQAEALQQRLKTIGIDVRIVTRDETSLINDAIAKQYQSMFVRNFAGGDPDSLHLWWYSGTTAADGTFTPNLLNFPGTRDAEIDRLLDEGRSEPDPARRQEIYEDLNRRMASQVVAAWSFYAPWGIAEQPAVHDVLGPPLPRGGAGEASDAPDDDPSRQPSRNLSAGNPLLGMWREQ
jgi:peptide/nickel transport system substrate-binding protein